MVGDLFTATTNKSINLGDDLNIPKGAIVKGKITKVQNEKKLKGKSHLELTLYNISFRGNNYALKSDALYFEGKNKLGNTAIKAGAGATIGAIAGALSSQKSIKGKGALIGAAAGAAAGAGATAFGNNGPYTLPAGQELSFKLTQDSQI